MGAAFILAALALVWHGAGATAQGVQDDSTSRALSATVKLPLGRTTLGDAAASLSQQTGLQIEAAGLLRDHRLILCIRSSTAAGALNMLAELNGWSWSEDTPGHILITRRPPKLPGNLPELSQALREALPADWLRFLASRSPEERPAVELPEKLRQGSFYERVHLLPAHAQRIRNLADSYADGLKQLLLSQADPGKAVPFTALTPEQRQAVAACMALDVMARTFGQADALDFILGNIAPYQRDPGACQVEVKNGGISITSVEETNGMRVERGFGGSLRPPTAPVQSPVSDPRRFQGENR